MDIRTLINVGAQGRSFSAVSRIKLTNIISLLTTVISGLYSINYWLLLDNPQVALINFGFTLAYLTTLAFMRKGHVSGAKTWFFSVLMVHLLICTNVYVTNASGFHLYYFLVPTGAFLLFELNQRREMLALSAASVGLFLYCENTVNLNPLIVLDEATNHLLYQSVILVNMIEVVFVLTIFARQIEANEKKLTQQAATDSLTGLANRHCFFSKGNNMLEQAQKLRLDFSLVLLDFDYFKNINDRYGHVVGDLCLVEISKEIKAICREQDLFARIGGEEFVIAMPNTHLEQAKNVAERMREQVSQHLIPIVGERSFTCTASFGVASAHHEQTLKDLLQQADKALYLAKDQGRNCVQLYSA
ncbi:GGDEF domain-containing protein [Agarivorans sp. MS3-6]|uniref:GGDEF domain-containing protein n=1 Tax=Agarivorans sp. TSD2052 TaxID=2937286 RepID=UPI0020102695|nr:GGDEF domain-containing protein [Agarivorans sp. TSD2052]UPW17008.1 GGDEF domain-containing protein [Agarivorans sp. TSD2052]